MQEMRTLQIQSQKNQFLRIVSNGFIKWLWYENWWESINETKNDIQQPSYVCECEWLVQKMKNKNYNMF